MTNIHSICHCCPIPPPPHLPKHLCLYTSHSCVLSIRFSFRPGHMTCPLFTTPFHLPLWLPYSILSPQSAHLVLKSVTWSSTYLSSIKLAVANPLTKSLKTNFCGKTNKQLKKLKKKNHGLKILEVQAIIGSFSCIGRKISNGLLCRFFFLFVEREPFLIFHVSHAGLSYQVYH